MTCCFKQCECVSRCRNQRKTNIHDSHLSVIRHLRRRVAVYATTAVSEQCAVVSPVLRSRRARATGAHGPSPAAISDHCRKRVTPSASRRPPRAPAGRGTAPLRRCRIHCHRDTAGRNSGWAWGPMTASDADGVEGGARCVRCKDADGGAPLSAAKDLAFAIRVSLCSGGRGKKQSRPGGRKYTTEDIMALFATTQEAQRGTKAERARARHLNHMSETSKKAWG